jgi:hypothetical protein
MPPTGHEAETLRRGVDDSVVGESIKEPQLSTLAKVAAANDSTAALYGRPPATGFNNWLESDWGSGVWKPVDPDGSLLNPVT